MMIVWQWAQSHADRILLLVAVVVIAAVLSKVVGRVLRRILDQSQIPSASIFVNLALATIWFFAVTFLLQPVFGINPTTLITALGVGGLALSLGFKDTIANIVGGFGLMIGKVIVPGDTITISGVTGTVVDITWRQTVVHERGGNELVIPNSLLNTSSLQRITPLSESCVLVPFTAKAQSDPADVSRRIAAAVIAATGDLALPAPVPAVRFTGFSPYGLEGNVVLFAKPDIALPTVNDAVVRALAHADFIEQRAAVGQ
ncbi:MAG: mechanosensitive ion channel family protein [Bifidobacterium mongoliense]|uniref:mechanosensitive ion channel family protein n=1 Tax=Bifidobacterium mongoliense TaxID=518643 RepID=UPI00264A12E2|nr:mechanosensitive ion channel domain-containing protein [Bifidobacterium mongoliense]MDN6783217.1 mechanosensitive ion channel family protein [Bifidobacterium mongoliense]